MKILTLDLGGTAIKAALMSPDGKLTDFMECPSNGKLGGEAFMKAAMEVADKYSGFDRIGISVSGQVNVNDGSILFANENIPGFTGTKVKEIFEKKYDCPVAVENDVNAFTIGEYGYGNAVGIDDIVCITIGTGVGGGIIVGGKVLYGKNGNAGELGHIITHLNGLNCACGGKGCYEQYASTTALVREAKKVDPTVQNGREIFAEFEKYKEVIDLWVDEIVVGIVGFVHTLAPSAVILGGGIMNEEYLINSVQEKLNKLLMPSYKNTVVKKAKLGSKTALLGAGKAAIDLA